ncbi:hypothetical protein [Novosphingobium sp. TH158]|uniref:hypothetical protein n=1 Tax=Novosphingobium sp. TH158 TaxID=2067455 RepID=UPI001181A295|nr:hypothetical protein [Novosphingobium sp. TH158]
MTDIVIDPSEGGKNLVIPTDKIPPAAWQAIYYHLSKKTETRKKLHSGAFTIDKDKIIDLIYRLKQSIVAYGPQAEKVEFTVAFRNDTSEQLSSLEKFIATDVSHKGAQTKSVAIDFDFIVCPANELQGGMMPPQKFKVFMLLDQDFFSDPDPEQAGFFNDGVAGKNVLSVIEYSEYSVSRALQGAVDEWVATLPRRDVPFVLKKLPTSIRAFNGAIPIFAAVLAIVPFMRFSNPLSFSQGALLLLQAMSAALFVFGFMKIFIKWALNTIAKIQPTTYLLISSGDQERRTRIEKEIKRRSARFAFVFGVVIVGFLVGTLSSLFASYIQAGLQ